MNKKRRPNIVILNPDQMRADTLAHLGNPASKTPNLDALAKEGISFRRSFCQNPVCTPSRCSFMSGWYPHVAGHRTMTHMMHGHEPVLLKYLKESGYQVWINQRNDLLPAQEPDYYKDYCTTYFRLPAGSGKAVSEHGSIKCKKDAPDVRTDAVAVQKPSVEECWRGAPDGDNYYSFYRGEITPKDKDVDELWTDGAVDFINNYGCEEPFCIFLPWMNPHPVYQVEEPYYSSIDREKLPKRIIPPADFTGKPRMERELHRLQRLEGWSEERFDELRAVYLGMCSKVDAMAGRVIAALKDKGIYEDTAVFFFSDHGDYTGDYGIVEKAQNCFEDCLVNVPLLVKLPAALQKRTGIHDGLVELVDFYATAEALADVGGQHTHFGHSLIPYISGASDVLREQVFCEGGFRKGEEHCKERGNAPQLDPDALYYPRQLLQDSDDMYNGKAIMCRTENYKYIRRLYEDDELYDLQNDPQELTNQIHNPEYAPVITDMKERLLNHYLDTCDAVPMQKDTRMEQAFTLAMMNSL